MSHHEFAGNETLSESIARLGERINNNDRRYEERWRSDQQALRDALDAAKEAVAAALSAAEKAVAKAEFATEARFESVNEFRAQLGDQANRLMPRAEFETQHTELVRQVSELRDAISDLRQLVAVGPADLKTLQAASWAQSGAKANALDSRAVLFAVIGVLVTAAAIISPHIH